MTSAHPSVPATAQGDETTGHPQYVMGASYERGEMKSGAVPLSSQVGGHAGVLSSEDGSLIIKPCLHNELDFYTSISASQAAIGVGIESDPEDIVTNDHSKIASPFEALAPWVPRFYGTLKLEGKIENYETADREAAPVIKPIPGAGEKDKCPCGSPKLAECISPGIPPCASSFSSFIVVKPTSILTLASLFPAVYTITIPGSGKYLVSFLQAQYPGYKTRDCSIRSGRTS